MLSALVVAWYNQAVKLMITEQPNFTMTPVDEIVINTIARYLERHLTEQEIEHVVSCSHSIALKFFVGTTKAVTRDDLERYLSSET